MTEEELNEIAEKARMGDREAIFSFGIISFSNKNYIKAFDLLDRASKIGNEKASKTLSNMRTVANVISSLAYRGVSIEDFCEKCKNDKNSFFSNMAEEDFIEFVKVFGETNSEEGKRVKDEFEKGLFISIKKEAEAGDSDEQVKLSDLYSKGIGCEKDIDTALFWLKTAYKKGNAKASYKMSGLHFNAAMYEDAKKDLIESCNKGYSKAKNKLIYFTNTTNDIYNRVDENTSLSDIYREYKAQDKLPDSDMTLDNFIEFVKTFLNLEGVNIGNSNKDGEDSNNNFDNMTDEERFNYIQKKAVAKDKEAQYKLGELYMAGVGCKRNTYYGVLNFYLSSKQGYKRAEYKIKEIYYSNEEEVQRGLVSVYLLYYDYDNANSLLKRMQENNNEWTNNILTRIRNVIDYIEDLVNNKGMKIEDVYNKVKKEHNGFFYDDTTFDAFESFIKIFS